MTGNRIDECFAARLWDQSEELQLGLEDLSYGEFIAIRSL